LVVDGGTATENEAEGIVIAFFKDGSNICSVADKKPPRPPTSKVAPKATVPPLLIAGVPKKLLNEPLVSAIFVKV
jgi:hypothetical protein